MNLEQELSDWGPVALDSLENPPSLELAQKYCRSLARSHYENFVVVGLFTPPHLKQSFEAIYGFCRWADDLGDETGAPHRSIQLLQWWEDQLIAVFKSDSPPPRHPVYVALAPVIKQHSLPINPFQNLISAFRQDQTKTRFETDEELADYCQRSANPVGELVLRLFGHATTENLKMSDDICTGLQLANFWQDVSRDLAKGRIYIPAQSLATHKLTEKDLKQVPASAAFRRMLAEEVTKTRLLFDSGSPLTKKLNGRAGLALRLFHAGGVATLNAIENAGFDVLTRRPSIGKINQLRLMARLLWQSFTERPLP